MSIRGKIGVLIGLLAFSFTMGQDSPLEAVSKSTADFGSSFYNELAKSLQDNFIFSPYSLSAVMAMVKAGARGDTAESIQTALKFPSDDKVLNSGFEALIDSLKSGENFTLESANRIYTNTGLQLNSQFESTLKQYYKAGIEQLNFAQATQAAKAINDFVSHSTRDKIQDLVSESDFDAMTRLVLVNAIYFKGLWKNKFNAEFTRPRDFYINSTDKVSVPMMWLEADFPHASIPELDAEAVALPYEGDKLSMLILLPNKIDGLKDMEEKLKTFPLSQVTSRLRDKKVQLQLPKFTLESTIDLQQPLTSLGAGVMFDQSKADFSGMLASSKEQLYVSKAIQKAFIEVNEEGSEAAAASAFGIRMKSAFIGPRVKADHPFIALIVGQKDNLSTPLFMTTFKDPRQTETTLRSSLWTSGNAPSGLLFNNGLLLSSLMALVAFLGVSLTTL